MRRQPKLTGSTDKVTEKKSFHWRPIVRILIVLSIIGIFVWVLFSPVFTVYDIVITGNVNVSSDSIKQVVPTDINLWRYPIKKVINSIKKVSPMVADVAVYRGVPSTIKIEIAEKVVSAIWSAGDVAYIVGQDGKTIMQPDKDYSVPRVVDTSGMVINANESVANPSLVSFIQITNGNYEGIMGSKLDHFEVNATTFEISLISQSTPKIILNTQRDGVAQLEAAKYVLDGHRDSIKEYIDLRVTGKAYIK